jgi:hypothetical protein
MKEPEIGPELGDVLELMVPDGHDLRSFVKGWQYIQHGPPLPTCWNLLEQLEAERTAKTKSGELILQIRHIAHRARLGDEQAGGILMLVALEATLRLNMLARSADAVLKWITHQCKLWPVVDSSFPTLRTTHQDLDALGIDSDSADAKARFSTASMATFMAASTVAYMHLVRKGLRNPSNQLWAQKVRKLPALTRRTARKWWKLADSEIREQFPDLAYLILGHLDPRTPKTDGEAMRRIRYPFIKSLWQLLSEVPQRSNTARPKTKVKCMPNKQHAEHLVSHKQRPP